MTSELMRATVAEPQVRGREAQDERRGRQTRDHRNTNWQRGRLWAASVRVNAKPEAHQDTAGRARWDAGKVQVLTRGDLWSESAGEVSRGRSSVEVPGKGEGAKGRRNHQQRSMEHCTTGPTMPGRQQAVAAKSRDPLSEPSPPTRCSRGKREGERNTRRCA
jgi:hypothetical protein